MAWLCIDAGTSLIKSVVFSDDGRELAVARTSVGVLRPCSSFAEQDMNEVWQAVVHTCRQAVVQAEVPIHAIASTAQGDGFWPVDEAWNPAHHAVLWNDARAASIVDGWKAAGILEEGATLSGSTSYPGLPNSIWRWFAAHRPDVLRLAKASLTCNGWLFLCMTGGLATDLSDASNPFCDVRRQEYSTELLRLYGVAELSRLLPPIKGGGPPSGSLLATVAAEMGVPAGIPVVMAPYDIVSTAHGAGCTEAGQACLILGTTMCAEVLSDDFAMRGSGTTLALGQQNQFLHAMPTLTGCEALTWAASLLRLTSIEELEALAFSAPAGAEGLLFLPYLSPAGERSPFLDPHARGLWFLLSFSHGSIHLARSVYEGLSFVVRECLEAAGFHSHSEVHVCGGGARSSFWCQMIADVTGRDVVRPVGEELGARGAFLHGQVKEGEAADLRSAYASLQCQEERFRSQPHLRELYDAGFARFLEARKHAEALWSNAAIGGLRG